MGVTEGFDATVGGEASSVLKDEWNSSVLGGSENTLNVPLSEFQFRKYCKPQTRSKVRLFYTSNSLGKNGPVKRTLTLYVVAGAHNGSIGLYVPSKSNPIAEIVTLKVFSSIDCANMSGQYVVLTEPVPSEVVGIFSKHPHRRLIISWNLAVVFVVIALHTTLRNHYCKGRCCWQYTGIRIRAAIVLWH